MISRELQKTYWDWLSTAERALRSLAEQRAFLSLRDVQGIEKIQPELDRLMTRLQVLDQDAVAATQLLAGQLETSSDIRSIVAALPKPEAQQVQSLSQRVRSVGETLLERASVNRTLIESELEFVQGTLNIFAQALTSTSQEYGQARQIEPVLMNQVA